MFQKFDKQIMSLVENYEILKYIWSSIILLCGQIGGFSFDLVIYNFFGLMIVSI